MSASPWIGPVTLELPGGRARLEPLTLEHAAGLWAAGPDADTWRFLPTAPPRSLQDMRAYVTRALDAADTGAETPFAIVDRSTGRVAGTTRYMDIQPEHRAAEIGTTWLGAAWRRTSVNTECKFLLLRHAFETLGAVRIYLKTDARNERSRAAILRIGATYEGCLRRSRILHDGYIRDTVYFSVTDLEWPRVREHLEALRARRPE